MGKVKCLKCNEILESKYRYHFVQCSCENETYIDGGSDYTRIGGKNLKYIKILTKNYCNDCKHSYIISVNCFIYLMCKEKDIQIKTFEKIYCEYYEEKLIVRVKKCIKQSIQKIIKKKNI